MVAIGLSGLAACGPDATPGDASPAANEGDDPSEPHLGDGDGALLYDPSRVARLEIEVTEEDLALLRSEAAQPFGFDDFTYVLARVTFDGTAFEDVGIRVKGNSSRVSASGDRFPFKLDLNRFVAGQRLDGQTKINLHNNDGLNEYLSYGAFRAYGVPASRTGWAEVWLNGSELGLYTLVEQVNDDMLAHYYDDPKADLYKPEPPSGYLTDRGDTIDAYEELGYKADNDTSHATFLRLIKTVNEEPASAWDEVIDVESVLTYFAGNVALGNWDTYVAMGHNYYLFEASPGRMVMLPWDLNLSQGSVTSPCPADSRSGGGPGGGGMGLGGSGEGVEPREGFEPPEGFGAGGGGGGGGQIGFGGGSAPLHDGLMQDGVFFARYLEILQDFLRGPGSLEALNEAIEVATATLGDRLTATAAAELRATIASRVEAIETSIPSISACTLTSAAIEN